MDAPKKYRQRAEAADRLVENCRDPQAKRFMQSAAERWRQLAELAERQEASATSGEQRWRKGAVAD